MLLKHSPSGCCARDELRGKCEGSWRWIWHMQSNKESRTKKLKLNPRQIRGDIIFETRSLKQNTSRHANFSSGKSAIASRTQKSSSWFQGCFSSNHQVFTVQSCEQLHKHVSSIEDQHT
eukprot:TRINITY_DN828_c0_g2_i1.p1 TRINITY_DN828_c0_g2~~TRINITY_DN828_c0_g2_i1.p1  ORF type:complete len:119 (+),score=10.60 TRINITY_DN828_c0_g2_i1:136-492(+)